MNFKSKKAVFDEKIINKEEISEDTRKKMRDSKYLILLMDIFMICVNGFMLAYFLVKGFNVVSLALICVVLAMDVIHFGLSFALNYRFKYNMVFTLAYSAVSLILTGVLYLVSDIMNKGVTIFETFGVGISIAIRLIYFITVIILLMMIAKKKLKLIQPIAFILIAGLLFGATITYNMVRGVYGGGSGLLEGNRTLEYMLKEDLSGDKYYEVVGSLDSDYINIVIPDEFNGHKVKAVDYSLFLTPEVKNIELKSTAPISITNSLNENPISDDLNITVKKELLNEFKFSVYNSEKLNDNLTKLINKVDPILPKGESAVKFNFDASNMPKLLKGKYLETIFLKKDESVKIKDIFNDEKNSAYKDFYDKNYLRSDYDWNFTNFEDIGDKKAMVMSANVRGRDTNVNNNEEEITSNTDITIHFEDVVKITYNFSPISEDVFEMNYVDIYRPDIEKVNYVIESNVNAIEFNEDIRPGCTVKWYLKGDDLNPTYINEKTKIAELLETNQIKSDNELSMEAEWTMITPEVDTFEVQNANGEAINSIVYGDEFNVVFKESNKAVNRNYTWIVKQGVNDLIKQSYHEDILSVDNFAFLKQNSNEGLYYNYFNDDWILSEKTQALLQNTLINGLVTMQMTFEVVDEHWEALKASINPSINLEVESKEVKVEWTLNGNTYPTGDIVYNANNNIVNGIIMESDICGYDVNSSNKPSLTLATNGQAGFATVRYAGRYTTLATVVDNLNYFISQQNLKKETNVTPAQIDIKYDVTASNFEPLNNETDINGKLNYIGYGYSVKPKLTILDVNGAPITIQDADKITDEMAYKWVYPADALTTRNAGQYTIKYGFDAELLADVKNSYRFVNKLNPVMNFDYSFNIKQATLINSDIVWDNTPLVYNGDGQKLQGEFAGIGEDINDPLVVKKVSTQMESYAKEYKNSLVSIDAEVSNYVLGNDAKTKTFRIEKKLIEERDIIANNTSIVFSNKNLNGNGGFSLTSNLNSHNITFTIEDALFNATTITEFINAGTYSELKVSIDERFKENYTFTPFVENEDSYTFTKKLENLNLTIEKYQIAVEDMQVISDKVYDNDFVPIPTSIISEKFGRLTYTVIIADTSVSNGINAGEVSYTISNQQPIDETTILDNFDFNTVLNASYSYSIAKRQIELNITTAKENIIYTGQSISFEYDRLPIGGNDTNCLTELNGKDFISFASINAVDVKADGGVYSVTDSHINAEFSGNYALLKAVDFAIVPFDLINLNNDINWGVTSGVYSGNEQGLNGTFTGLTGTSETIVGTKYINVKRENYLVTNADVLPYVYGVQDFTISNINYMMSEATNLSYTITPKTITQGLISGGIQQNSNLERNGKNYQFTYSGNVNTITGTDSSALWFKAGNNDSNKIALQIFRGNDFSPLSLDFTNATVNENFQVEPIDLIMYSSDGNYVFSITKDYSMQIDKKEITLDINTNLTYNGNEQYPRITNTDIEVHYAPSDDTDRKNFGEHFVNVTLEDDYKRNFKIQGASDDYSKTIKYNIIKRDLDINDESIIEYRATQDISDIANDFDTMISLDNLTYNAKPWYIVARITVTLDNGVVETAYIYTSDSDNFTKTDAGIYNINVDASAITAYGDGITLAVSNYKFTSNLTKEVVIKPYAVSQDMMKAYFEDDTDSDLIANPKAEYNGAIRMLIAKFTPGYDGATEIALTVSVEEIKNAKEYTATFSFGDNANNFAFAEGANTLVFTIEQAVIDASVNTITWTKDTVDYKVSKTEKFEGSLIYNNNEIVITSNFQTCDAGTYTNGSGYTDIDFILSDANYRIVNVNHTFTINKAEISESNVLWYADGSSEGIPTTQALKPKYNYGNMPNIVAKYQFTVGGENAYEIIFVVTPLKDDYTYNAFENGQMCQYNFVASLKDADAVNYKFNNVESISRIVNIDKMDLTDANAIKWDLPNSTKDADGNVIVQYSGLNIVPIATIGAKVEELQLKETYEHINVSNEAYTVSLNALQNNFTLNESATFQFSYYIVRKELTAADVVFRNNKATAEDTIVKFEYKEGGLTTQDLSAYILVNGEQVEVTVSDNATEHNVGGAYTLEVSMTNANFNLNGTVEYTIVPKDIVFEWSNLLQEYSLNEETHLPNLSINGNVEQNIIDGLSVEIDGQFVSVENKTHLVNAGTYTIKFTNDLSLNENYNIINETAQLVINKLDIKAFAVSRFKVTPQVVIYTGKVLDKPHVIYNNKINFKDSSIKLYLMNGSVPNDEPVASLIDIGRYTIKIDCVDEINFTGTKTLETILVVRK